MPHVCESNRFCLWICLIHKQMFHLFVNQTNVNCVLQTCLTFTCILFGTAPQLDTFEVKLQVAFHTFWAAGCQCTCNSIFQSAYHLCEVYLLILYVQLLLFLRMSPVMVRGVAGFFHCVSVCLLFCAELSLFSLVSCTWSWLMQQHLNPALTTTFHQNVS